MLLDVQADNTISQLANSFGISEDTNTEQNSLFSQILGSFDGEELSSDSLLKIVEPSTTNISTDDLSLDDLLNNLGEDVKVLNPDLGNVLSVEDLKQLIADAKQYLKDKIQALPEYKKSSVKELPNTLGGLVDLAKKMDLDISKITLDEVSPKLNKDENSVELFKTKKQTTITTQELVSTKQSKNSFLPNKKIESKNQVSDNLKLLLQGESALKKDGTMTQDFSVATAKVIAPQKSVVDSLESLLNEDKESLNQPTKESVKVDLPTQTLKADDFEVKVKEAKQMVKYLSQDVKQAIDDYKAPFSRVKIQLNPKNLGDVDLTIVQRGNNLHVNITSNNAAINTLAMNANDLKTQLQNNGINNASLNFSNNSEQGFSSQQNQQQNQQAKKEYMYFDNEEQNEEVLSSLEIVLPNYV